METSYYFHHQDWCFNTDPVGGMKIPTALVVLAAPIMGAMFLMFLPFVGFYLTGQALVRKFLA